MDEELKHFTYSHKNTNLGSSTIYLAGVDMIEIANSILIIETYFYMILKRINIGLFAVETVGACSCTSFRHETHIY